MVGSIEPGLSSRLYLFDCQMSYLIVGLTINYFLESVIEV